MATEYNYLKLLAENIALEFVNNLSKEQKKELYWLVKADIPFSILKGYIYEFMTNNP